MSGLAPLEDLGTGPEPVPGELVELLDGVARLTAANASMMTGPGTNTYLVGRESLVVVDPGPDDPEHRLRIVEAVDGRPVDAVVTTHHHPDHLPGAAPLARVLGAPHAAAQGPVGSPDLLLGDGDRIGSGPSSILALATPGHASDHLCLLVEEHRLLLSGDHLMGGSTVVIRPPDGDLGAYLASLARLRALDPPVALVGPAHGRLLRDPIAAIDEVVAHREARHGRVLDALSQHERSTAAALLDDVYPGLEEGRRAIATATLLSHLLLAIERGEAAAAGPQPGDLLDLEVAPLVARPGPVRGPR